MTNLGAMKYVLDSTHIAQLIRQGEELKVQHEQDHHDPKLLHGQFLAYCISVSASASATSSKKLGVAGQGEPSNIPKQPLGPPPKTSVGNALA
jgi:hypothetical protein